MNQFLSNKITAGIVAVALLVGVGVLISSGDTSSTTRNAALVVATPCTKPGQVTKVSKQSVVCATTNTGSLWYATMKAKGKAQPCTKPGAIRRKSKIVWVCGVVKKKKLWQATQPLPPAVVASTTVIEPGAPVVADNAVLADVNVPDDTTPKQTGAGDDTAPVLVSITATSSIDTSSADQSVTIDMNITDDVSGVKFVVVNLSGPLGNSIVQSNAAKLSGTTLNGKYQATMKVPKKSPQGDLAIDVWVRDLVGNDLNTRNAATVKQTGAGDDTAPVLVSITATSSIDTSSADQSVTIDMNITDDVSGVKFVVVNLSGPLGNSIVQSNAAKLSGTALNGKYQATMKVPMKSPQGDLAIDVWVRDLVGNDLNTRNAATVKQTGAGDDTAPVLVSITATSSIDTSSADQSVTIDMNITDDASGVKFVVVNLSGPLGNSIVQSNAAKLSGTALNGKYRVTVKVPKNSPQGDLAIDVWVRDLVGNDLNTRNAATVKQTGA